MRSRRANCVGASSSSSFSSARIFGCSLGAGGGAGSGMITSTPPSSLSRPVAIGCSRSGVSRLIGADCRAAAVAASSDDVTDGCESSNSRGASAAAPAAAAAATADGWSRLTGDVGMLGAAAKDVRTGSLSKSTSPSSPSPCSAEGIWEERAAGANSSGRVRKPAAAAAWSCDECLTNKPVLE